MDPMMKHKGRFHDAAKKLAALARDAGRTLAKAWAWLCAPLTAYTSFRETRISQRARSIAGVSGGPWLTSWQPLSLVGIKAGIVVWASLALHAYALGPLAEGLEAAFAFLGLGKTFGLATPTPELARDIAGWALVVVLGLNGAWLGSRLVRAAFAAVAVDGRAGLLLILHGTPLRRRATLIRASAAIASSVVRNPAQALFGLGDLELRLTSGETLRIRSLRRARSLLKAFMGSTGQEASEGA